MRDNMIIILKNNDFKRNTYIIDKGRKYGICLFSFTFLLFININKIIKRCLWTSIRYKESIIKCIVYFIVRCKSCVTQSLYQNMNERGTDSNVFHEATLP